MFTQTIRNWMAFASYLLFLIPFTATAQISTLSEFQADYVFFDPTNPSTAGYDDQNSTYLGTNNYGSGNFRAFGVPGILIANDIYGSIFASFIASSSGPVSNGNIALIAGSNDLGIATGTTWASATISGVQYDSDDFGESMLIRARVDTVSPALSAVIGPIKSIYYVEYLYTGILPDSWTNNPWTTFLGTPSFGGPDVFFSSSVLPLTLEEAFTDYILLNGVPSSYVSSYNASTQAYELNAPYGEKTQEGRIREFDTGDDAVNDIIGDFSVTAQVDNDGEVNGGTLTLSGGSAALGIAPNTILISGTVEEVLFSEFESEPKIEILVTVDFIRPNLEAVIGPLETIVVYDFQIPPPTFIDDPWSVSYSGESYRLAPQIFTTSESLMNSDSDGDGIADTEDNCLSVSNGDQRDADLDGIGSLCDVDLNNDCIVNFLDFAAMANVFFTDDDIADINGDGTVNFIDYVKIPPQLFRDYTVNNPSSVSNLCAQSKN